MFNFIEVLSYIDLLWDIDAVEVEVRFRAQVFAQFQGTHPSIHSLWVSFLSFIAILCYTWVLFLDCVVISISFLFWFCFLLDSLSLTTKPELLISYYTRTVFTTKIWTASKNQCLFKLYIYEYLMYYVYWLTVIDYTSHSWTGIYVVTVVSSCGTLLPSDA